MGPPPRRSAANGYATAIVAVGVAGAITFALSDVLSSSLALLFIAAIVVVTLHGGLGPALLASFLAAAAFVTLTRRGAGVDAGHYVLQPVAFVSVAFLIGWLTTARRRSEEALRRAHAELETRVRERTAALDAANADLRGEVQERRRVQEQILSYQGRLQSLASELSVAEERERRRLAATLHDGVGHRLAVAVMKIRSQLREGQPNGSGGEMARVCQLIEEAIDHTRSLTLQLSPPILYELGLLPALEWLAARVEKDHGLRVHVTDLGMPGLMDDEVRSLLFSAVRELLMNVVKHATAANAWVTLQAGEACLQVEVEDDGQGCDAEALTSGVTAGFGLFHLRERLTHLDGSLVASSRRGKGCRVQLRVPSGRSRTQARARR